MKFELFNCLWSLFRVVVRGLTANVFPPSNVTEGENGHWHHTHAFKVEIVPIQDVIENPKLRLIISTGAFAGGGRSKV